MNKSLHSFRPASLQPFAADKNASLDQLKSDFRIDSQPAATLKTKVSVAKPSHLSFGAGLQLQPLNSFAPPNLLSLAPQEP